MDDSKDTTSGWKWIAGGLALIVSYQLGYSSGSSQVSAPINSAATYVDTGFDNSSMAMDTNMMLDAPPILTASAPMSTDVLNVADEPIQGDTAVLPVVPPQPVPPSANGRDLLAESNLSNSDEADYADTQTSGPTASSYSPPTYPAARHSPPTYAATPPLIGCAENGTCYGDISATTGLPKTTYVRGYTRRDGTYVRSHYRSRR